jgi:isoleucyl-tRNA synthetase
MRCADEWRFTLGRIGRWLDFDNDYKTMDLNFMESVWWVFKQIYDKNLVYRGFKIMPYSTGCTTVLSNFEAKSNYKDITEKSIIVSFEVLLMDNTYLLAWTTTPWTLPSNLALCMNPNIIYRAKLLGKVHGVVVHANK